MRCAQPIRLSYHPGLVESSIFSRQGVLLTVPSEIFGGGQVKAAEDHLTTAHFWAINEFGKCSATAPSWDLYVRSGDNVVNAKARAN